MGGNAIVGSVRMNRERFQLVSREITHKFEAIGVSCYIVPSYKSKSDFGDVDVVIWWEKDVSDLVEFLRTTCKPAQLVQNSNVISFEFERHQIDVIAFTNEIVFEFACCYFSHSDLSNLIGRVARRLGMKLGHDGLWLIIRDPENYDQVIDEILVTDIYGEALHILGYNPSVHNDGFETPEQIFEYVTTSKYFNPEGFVLGNRNYVARTRDKKRVMYNMFLTYLSEKYGITEDTKLSDGYNIPSVGLGLIESQFPYVYRKYEKSLIDYDIKRRLKLAINGNWITDDFGLKGKSLGSFITNIRSYLKRHQLEYWAAFESVEVVRGLVQLLASEGRFDEKEVQQTRSSGV